MADPAKLSEFVQWCRLHITGDEKGEAQIFLDRLFQAFGQPGSLDVGGSPEFRVRKSGEDGGGTSFADYVWKPIVLVEMRSSPKSSARSSSTPSAARTTRARPTTAASSARTSPARPTS